MLKSLLTARYSEKIVFAGRRGFAQLAVDAGVPIVPVVTAGAGESLLILTDGQRLAPALRLDSLLRVKALPVAISGPWGLTSSPARCRRTCARLDVAARPPYQPAVGPEQFQAVVQQHLAQVGAAAVQPAGEPEALREHLRRIVQAVR